MHQAHLVVKEDTNDKKAKSVYKDIAFEELKTIGEGCHSISYRIPRSKAIALMALVESEVERGDNDGINYILLGKSKVSGKFGDSSASTTSVDTEMSVERVDNYKKSLEKKMETYVKNTPKFFGQLTSTASYISLECADALLRDGHSCVSWAIAMIKAMQLKYHESALSVFAMIPSLELKGKRDADDPDPTTKCLLM